MQEICEKSTKKLFSVALGLFSDSRYRFSTLNRLRRWLSYVYNRVSASFTRNLDNYLGIQRFTPTQDFDMFALVVSSLLNINLACEMVLG